MDTHCSNCREPWDYYHLLHDEIYETDLSDFSKKRFNGNLDQEYRDAFQKLGWRFGSSILNIRHCPCCKDDTVTCDPLKDVLDDVMGDDLDAMICTHEDYDL